MLAHSRIRIEVPQPHELARGIVHTPNAHIGVVHGHGARGEFREAHAEQFARHVEHALPKLLELQIGFQFVGVEVVLRLADFLRVVAIVPGLDADPGALRVGEFLHVGDLFANPQHGRLPHGFHEFHGPFRRSCHRVLETPVRVCRVAQQASPLGAQLQDLADQRVVISRVAVVAAVDESAPDFLAQLTARGVGEEGFDRRARVGHDPLALLPAALRVRCEPGAQRLR